MQLKCIIYDYDCNYFITFLTNGHLRVNLQERILNKQCQNQKPKQKIYLNRFVHHFNGNQLTMSHCTPDKIFVRFYCGKVEKYSFKVAYNYIFYIDNICGL